MTTVAADERRMKGVVITEPWAAAVYELPRWDPTPGEVLIRCVAAGVCTTERSIFSGQRPIYPALGGHELVGVVASAPDTDHPVRMGDLVAVDAVRRCGRCHHCLHGRSNQCHAMRDRRPREGLVLIGGGFAEYTTVRADGAFPLPRGVDHVSATLIEPLACCLHSVKAAELHTGDTVVVLGAGTMGLLHLQLAVRAGSRALVIDVNAERLALAAQLGAEATLDSGSGDPVGAVREATGGGGADAVFVTAGSREAGAQALAMARPMARVVFYASVYPSVPFEVDWNHLHYAELRLMGSRGCTEADFADAVRLFVDADVDLGALVAARIALDDLPEELGRPRRPSGRVVVEHQQGFSP